MFVHTVNCVVSINFIFLIDEMAYRINYDANNFSNIGFGIAENITMPNVKTKGSRVRKGPYIQYLKDLDPFLIAPRAFKTKDEGTSCTADNDNGTVPISTASSVDEEVAQQTKDFEEENNNIAVDEVYADKISISTEFLQDAVLQNKLVNENEDDIYSNDFEGAENVNMQKYYCERILSHAEEEFLGSEKDSNTSGSSDDLPNNGSNDNVHESSTLTMGASMLLIVTFALKYSLTGEGLCDLLSLIDLHCPTENKLPKSLTQFRKWFQDIRNPLVFHNYCSHCHMYVGKNEDEVVECPNEKCKIRLTKDSVSHFIEIPIKNQIQAFVSRPTFLNDISYRFNRKKEHPDSIEDIYDGQVYKNLSKKDGVLEHPYNISLLWNTDGVPCFKSSKMSLWPLFFQINELPYNKRSDPENMILGGLWFGPSKPTIMCFTEPFLRNLQDLEENGIKILTPEEKVHSMKVIVIAGTADMPARSLLCNTIQFNGKFGCCKCLQPGETLKTGKRGHVHVFPFQTNRPDGPLRTHEGIVYDTFSSVDTGKPCNGIKGPNFLMCLKYYDLAKGTCIDYMHGVLLGVTKLLLTLWFSTDNNKEVFSLSHYIGLVDERLKSIKPPNNIKRAPRSISEHLKYWKASELRSWLLYYSAPLLHDIQHVEYFKLYLLFVNAVYILLQNSITLEDLKKAEDNLLQFVCTFSEFYKARYMTCNIHQLIHLPQMVYEMGPLWAYSCFPFENCNGTLLQLYNGTQHIDEQIAQTVSLMQRLPELQHEHLKYGSAEFDLYQSLKGICVQKNNKFLQDNISVVGAVKRTRVRQDHLDILSLFLDQPLTDYVTFNRIKIGREVLHSKLYQRCSVRNSFSIAYSTETDGISVGQVEYYLQLHHCITHKCQTSHCRCPPLHVALVNQFEIVEDSGLISELKHVDVVHSEANRNSLHVVPLHNILYKCVFVEVKNSFFSYACKMPNSIEKD